MEDISKSGIRPAVIEEIREIARQHQIARVILFGSRARGDYHERSDIDLAVTGGCYEKFALDIDEKTATLLMYDVINLDGHVNPELREAIAKEGVVLYEKI